jgi:hypothetical protein
MQQTERVRSVVLLKLHVAGWLKLKEEVGWERAPGASPRGSIPAAIRSTSLLTAASMAFRSWTCD